MLGAGFRVESGWVFHAPPQPVTGTNLSTGDGSMLVPGWNRDIPGSTWFKNKGIMDNININIINHHHPALAGPFLLGMGGVGVD